MKMYLCISMCHHPVLLNNCGQSFHLLHPNLQIQPTMGCCKYTQETNCDWTNLFKSVPHHLSLNNTADLQVSHHAKCCEPSTRDLMHPAVHKEVTCKYLINGF